MNLYVSKGWIAYTILLVILSIISGYTYPAWFTICLVCFFLIRTGHEFAHALVCKKYNIPIESIYLELYGEHSLDFIPTSEAIAAEVFLAGIVYDSIIFAVAILSSLFSGFWNNDIVAISFGCVILMLASVNFLMPNSDFQNFLKYTEKNKA